MFCTILCYANKTAPSLPVPLAKLCWKGGRECFPEFVAMLVEVVICVSCALRGGAVKKAQASSLAGSVCLVVCHAEQQCNDAV